MPVRKPELQGNHIWYEGECHYRGSPLKTRTSRRQDILVPVPVPTSLNNKRSIRPKGM
ncbi:MAG: hypothetical protein WDN75_17520 [Bacteroidota bacterium]